MSARVFVIDVYDGTPALQGEGPLPDILSVTVTEELDRAGQITAVIPATDARAQALLANDYELRVRTPNGQVASGLIQTFTKSTQNGVPVYVVSGTDRLGELNHLTTGYNRRYNNQATEAVIIGATGTAYSLLADTGWSAGGISIEADYTPWTIALDGTTRLAALIQLATEIGHHFREGSTARSLDFGVFGADSGYRLLNMHRATVAAESTDDVAFVGDIQVDTISADIENRLFPLGANRFDMRDAPTTITDILAREARGLSGFATTNDAQAAAGQAVIPVTATTDGTRSMRVGEEVWVGDATDWTASHECGVILSISAGVSITLTDDLVNTYAIGASVLQRPQFYIENAASQAAHGVREGCPQFPWIGFQSTAVDSDIQAAFANTLYEAAKARLARYKDTYAAYAVPYAAGIPHDLRVGQKIRLTYHGAMGSSSGAYYLNVDADLYVMSISRAWVASGIGHADGLTSLTLASVDRPTPINASLVLYNLDTSRWVGLT